MTTSSAILIEKSYQLFYRALNEAVEVLKGEFMAFKDDASFLKSRAATTFVLNWMREHFLFQKRFDALFQRSVMQASSDWFTAAIALALEKYLATNGHPHSVRSELALKKQRGMPRPDISIWANENQAVGVIECKTNLGYERRDWKKKYEERTAAIHRLYPGCLSFLLVLTKENWKESWGLFEQSELAGKRWFCVSDVWPSRVGNATGAHIRHPFELMFVDIRKALEAGKQSR